MLWLCVGANKGLRFQWRVLVKGKLFGVESCGQGRQVELEGRFTVYKSSTGLGHNVSAAGLLIQPQRVGLLVGSARRTVISISAMVLSRTQSIQNPLIKEYTLNHIKDPIII